MQNRVITMGSLFDGIGGFSLVSMCAEGFFRRFMEKTARYAVHCRMACCAPNDSSVISLSFPACSLTQHPNIRADPAP
ncbi:Uncharacterised protein [uncultured Blautia sp.]|nr:Uncharacterised protein [uncultured Blautia sp.]